MTGSQRELADRLFAEAVAVTRDKQAAYLSENCDDAEVRHEVESLLAFASRPLAIAEVIEHAAGGLTAPDFAGLRVGPYRLTGRIGQGGMGAVYRAVRDDDQFQKTVAIKMLRFPDGDPAVLERFRHERQILAALEHPNIARLLDGGAWIPPGSSESQPYIVMECVEGLPLAAYCDEENLTVSQRLRLFRRVCDALSYAHRQLVVHRDVKPSNILVTPDGTPKLLDFGVSKLLTPGGTITMTVLAMTPDYASPEQVRGEPVSTLTDVYSLGVVLYELLTGRRPHELATCDPLEIARAICEREVLPPRVNTELDLIVLKAMQNEPARRYQSVEQFSEDIRRYLEGLPIVARPDTVMYRAAKFARRHWLGLAAAGAVFVALVGGIAVSAWEARRADTEAATAKAVNEFLQNDLLAQAGAGAQAGPSTRPDPHLEVRTALDRAAARIAHKFDKQPLVEASVRQTIGDAYKDLGLLAEAKTQVARALELRRRALGQQAPDTLRSLNDLAELDWVQGRTTEAGDLWTQLLATERRVLGEEHPDTLNTMNNMAVLLANRGKSKEAEALYRRVLEVRRRKLGGGHLDTLTSMNNLGLFYENAARYELAEPLLTAALETERRMLGEEHPNTLTSMNNLAKLYADQGRFREAGELVSKVAEARRRVLGEDHPATLTSMNNLGKLFGEQGNYAGAEDLLAKTLEARRRVLGAEHTSTLTSMNNLAVVYRDEGRYGDAEALHSKVLEAQRRVLGAEHPETLFTMNYLGLLYSWQGRYAEAEGLLAGLVEVERRVLGQRHIDTTRSLATLGEVRLQQWRWAEAESPLREAFGNYRDAESDAWGRYRAQSLLGASLVGQQKYAEAEPLLLAGYQGLLERQSTIPADSRSAILQAGERLVRLYRVWGKPEPAAEWQKKINASDRK